MKVNTEFKEVKGIGNIPVDWKVKTTGGVFNTITDYVANGSFASLNENVTYRDAEDYAILVRLTDYKNGFTGPFIYVDKHSYDFLKKSSLKSGDVIISNVGAYAGFTFKIKELNKPMTLGPNAILVRGDINNDFIYYWFTSKLGQYSLKNIISTTAQPKFNKTDFKTLLIPVPSKKEQEKIAQILSNVDMNIEKTEQAIAKYKQVKKGLMDDLLTGKIRIKDGKRFRETNFKDVKGIGKIPWDWKIYKLGDLTEIISGGTPKREVDEYWVEGNIFWATPTDVTNLNSMFINSTKEKITELGLNNSSAKVLPAGTVLMCSRATIGPRVINSIPMATNQGFKSFICNNKYIINNYLYYIIDIIKDEFINIASGSTFLEISKSQLEEFKVGIPDLKEQKKVAQIILNIDMNLEKEEKYLEKLKKLKSGLMEDLLTGKVRVNTN